MVDGIAFLISLGNHHAINGKTHELSTGPFSLATLNYQRVPESGEKLTLDSHKRILFRCVGLKVPENCDEPTW